MQGQLLGTAGQSLQQIQRESGARVEVQNSEGNLKGAHPDPLDRDVFALISADSQVGLPLLSSLGLL